MVSINCPFDVTLVPSGWIERILKPGAQVAAEIGAALMQRPDFGASDRGDLPMRVRQFQLEQDRQQFRIGRHARSHAHHEIIFERPGIHAGLPVHADAAHDADVEAFEFGNRLRVLHDVEIILHLLDRIIEHHRRPRPGVVALYFQIIQRAGVAGRHLRPGLAHAIERAGIIRTRGAGGVVDDDARAGFADRLLDLAGDADLPRRQMAPGPAPAGADGCASRWRRRRRRRLASRAICSGVTGT